MSLRNVIRSLLATAIVAGGVFASSGMSTAAEAPAVAACENVSKLRSSTASRSAQAVAAGSFTPDGKVPAIAVPAFCRVGGTLRPVERSRIGYELWLPLEGWNGRLTMLGNGGYSSALPWLEMAGMLNAGYAVVATDTGHDGDGPIFAVGHPESIVDWGHRAVHLTALDAKRVVKAFYERPAHHAYFRGCSTGGHQALMEAQRYPGDFDGIVAGAPGNNRTNLNAGFLWQFVQNHTRESPPREIIPATKLPMITKAVLEACRSQNGAVAGGLPSDRYLNDPLSCDFDPGSISCQSADETSCLTPDQVEALRRMYAGAHNPRTGARIYFGWPPGSESGATGRGGWSLYWADPANATSPARADFWRHWVFDDAQWDWRTFDFDRDITRLDKKLAASINATNPNLERFHRRGGKLIHYHGEADPVVPFADSIDYWQRVNEHRSTDEFYRLYLAPGLGHCQGGAGPAPTDLQQAIERWVEHGVAPDSLEATRASGGVNDEAFSRPLCRYPKIARYDGHGPPNDAGSFACVIAR
jgi:feruloyl esterase